MTDKSQVLAPFAGKVLAIRVHEGDSVGKGQILVDFETMRTENSLVSAQDGRISRIYVEDGDIVDAGTVLFTYSETAG